MSGDANKLVFVSYAHADRKFLDGELMPFLRQLELGDQIELWHDRLIGTGENWYAEIADRLDHAKVAILLITPAFLGSKFCLPPDTNKCEPYDCIFEAEDPYDCEWPEQTKPEWCLWWINHQVHPPKTNPPEQIEPAGGV